MKPKSIVDACRRHNCCPLVLAARRRNLEVEEYKLNYYVVGPYEAAEALDIDLDIAAEIAYQYDQGRKMKAASLAIRAGIL